jgi:hypothetical protein
MNASLSPQVSFGALSGRVQSILKHNQGTFLATLQSPPLPYQCVSLTSVPASNESPPHTFVSLMGGGSAHNIHTVYTINPHNGEVIDKFQSIGESSHDRSSSSMPIVPEDEPTIEAALLDLEKGQYHSVFG